MAEAAGDRAGHEGWTWGAGQSVFAASPDRVFRFPARRVARARAARDAASARVGPTSCSRVAVPIRDATVAARARRDAAGRARGGGGARRARRRRRWEHCILVFDRDGNIVEDWTQWDSMLARPHAVYVSPYDPDKHVWIVDDFRHAIFKFTNDGKRLVQTIGTVERARAPTRRTSSGRRSWRGCPTARSSSPTATRTRAS